jgi:hypothetical protein
MKPLLHSLLGVLLGMFSLLHARPPSPLGHRPVPLRSFLLPPTCFGNGSTSASACGNTVTFNFTSFQISSCPNSGKMPAPGSVAFGGPGSSASFSFYHTLSYSPSNEHQQLVFSVPITTFQFSCSGPFGSGEVFSVQVYNGATQVGNHTFNVPGQGVNLTYYITGASFDRVQFTEINAVSADDELFGDFFVAGPGCPLPVEMLSADARIVDGDKVRIEWETIGESILDYFEVQRSTDGQTWEPIGREAARNIEGPNYYSLDDRNPVAGVNYYRVETMGLAGDHNFSQVMQVNVAGSDALQVSVWPNPAQGHTRVDLSGLSGLKTVEVIDMLGKVVVRHETTEPAVNLDLTDYDRAVYLLRITHEGKHATQKLVVN